MKKYVLSALIFSVFFSVETFSQQGSSPQSAETQKKDVVALIQRLFEGMKANDSSKVRTTFHEVASLHTTAFRNGKPQFSVTKIDDFLKAVGSPKKDGAVYDERILGYDVRIDDAMATVWTPYQFYVGEKFSHCGVNAFHCVLTDSGWKISHITDTRRKEPCEQR